MGIYNGKVPCACEEPQRNGVMKWTFFVFCVNERKAYGCALGKKGVR